jgi:hypothetical protein
MSYAKARTAAANMARETGCDHAIITCGHAYSVVPAFIGDELYPGRVVDRIEPEGR